MHQLLKSDVRERSIWFVKRYLYFDVIDFYNDAIEFCRYLNDYSTNNISSAYILCYRFYDRLITKQKFLTS